MVVCLLCGAGGGSEEGCAGGGGGRAADADGHAQRQARAAAGRAGQAAGECTHTQITFFIYDKNKEAVAAKSR